MGEQLENKFTWVIENFSGLKSKLYSDQFVVGGCKWRALAYPKGNGVDYLSLYLDVVEFDSLPSGWRRLTLLRFRVVNQFSKESSKSIVKESQHWFDAHARDWGFASMMPLTILRHKDNGYLLNNKLIIEVEVDVLKVIGKLDVLEKSKKAAAPLSKPVGTLVADAPAIGPQGDSPHQQEQKTADPSKEDSDDGTYEDDLDGDTFEEDSDDDASEEDSDDDASKEDSDDDVFEEDSDEDASEEDSDQDALPIVSKGRTGDISSLNPSKPLKKASESATNGVAECNNVSFVAEASNILLKEAQPEKETVDVNGFQVLSSQVKSVSQIFSRHPDTASNFRPKNRQLRTAYMNVLLGLIKTLCRPSQELSKDDLRNANNSLADLMDAGLKVDWLKPKLEEVSRKKKSERACDSRLQELQEEARNLMLMVSDFGAKLEKEKAKMSAAKAPLSFDDVV